MWQPIETAPKNGTKFLAYWPPSDDEWVVLYAICHFSFGTIWPSWIDEKDMPTHWMPLPEPPKEGDVMTDDLVQRLRWLGDHASFEPHMHHAAADRIEALEAALRKICDGPRDADKSYPELFAEVRIEARAALGMEEKIS